MTEYYRHGITYCMRTKIRKASHLTVKGQVTLPKPFRDALGWTTRTKLAFIREGDGVKIVAANGEGDDPGEALVKRMWGIGTSGMTTDEIMAMTRGED